MSEVGYANLVTRLDDLHKRSRQSEPDPPPTLCHYTDGNGLLGIINSQSVWASNAGFLNDPSEPGHGHTIMRKATDTAIDIRGGYPLIKFALEELLKFQREELEPLPQAYVFCLSQSVDLLSQWERYGGQCSGYLIEFDTKILLSENGFLFRVIYDPAEQFFTAVDVFDQICREVSEWSKKHEETCSEDEMENVRRIVIATFLTETTRLATQFKVQAFAEEKEWRIVDFFHPEYPGFNEPPEFRLGARSLKPYKILGLPPRAIRRIITGPFLDSRARKAVELLLQTKRLDVKVEPSQISYAR